MVRIVALALTALVAAFIPGAPTRRGPPLICFPIEIGAAKTLPYDLAPESRPAKQAVIATTPRLLAGSDDALFHMETLRRAYFILGSRVGGGISGPATAEPEVFAFVAALKDAVISASLGSEPEAPPSRAETLAWFDLGYFLAIKENCLHGRDLLGDLSCHPLLERAAEGDPKDACLQFGVAFAQLHNDLERHEGKEGPETTLWRSRGRRHLQAALDLMTPQDSLLVKNVCALLADNGPFGQPTTIEAVRTRFGLGAPTSRGMTIGTIDSVCNGVVVVRLVAPGDPPDSRLSVDAPPIEGGARLDVIKPDRATYVGQLRVIGNASAKTLACTVYVSGRNGVERTVVAPGKSIQPGDLVILGL